MYMQLWKLLIQSFETLLLSAGTRPWQIIPKDSPIILFFYSQIFSPLFSQTSHYSFKAAYYSYIILKLILKTSVNVCSRWCRLSRNWLPGHKHARHDLVLLNLTPKLLVVAKLQSCIVVVATCSVQKSQLCTVAKRQFNVHYSQIIPFGAYYSQLIHLVPIILKLFRE